MTTLWLTLQSSSRAREDGGHQSSQTEFLTASTGAFLLVRNAVRSNLRRAVRICLHHLTASRTTRDICGPVDKWLSVWGAR